MIKTLYISHQFYDFSSHKCGFLSVKNYKKVVNDQALYNVCFTVEDFTDSLNCTALSAELMYILENSQHINVVGLDEHFLSVVPDLSAAEYIFVFNKLKEKHIAPKVSGFDWITRFNLKLIQQPIAQRTTDQPHLWVAGCSISAGEAVPVDEKYPNILSKKLNLPLVLLAKGGSSIEWQSDQLAIADIRSGDTIVWGLTNFCRLSYTSGTKWNSATVNNYHTLPHEKQYWKESYFISPSLAYSSINNITKIQRICQLVGADLYLVNLLELAWPSLLFDKNYLDLTPLGATKDNKLNFLDYGSDGMHPGPQQHRYYADQIYNLIRK